MRPFVAGSLLSLLAALPLTAQFEGTVTVSIPAAGKSISDMTYFIQGGKLASSATMAAGSGQMAGKELRFLYDIPGQKATMLMPMPMGNFAGMKNTLDLKQMASTKKVEIKPLGSSQTIAGYRCDEFEVSEDGKATTRLCMTQELGPFAIGLMSPGGRGGSTPSWSSALGSHPGFPLKVWEVHGKVLLEVTAIHREPVHPEVFLMPDGYMDMSAMSGMMNGMGGRGPGKP